MPRGVYQREPWMWSCRFFGVRKKARELRAKGLSYRVIARALGTSHVTIIRICREEKS